MTNLNEYYQQQAGTGIAVYPGVRYQRGRGFFGRFFKGSLLPLLQSLGHKMLSTGIDVADDVVNNNMDPLTALKSRGRTAMKDAANEIIHTARSKIGAIKQDGSGRRKSIKGRRKTKRLTSKPAVVKKTSRSKKVSKKKSVASKPKRKTTSTKRKIKTKAKPKRGTKSKTKRKTTAKTSRKKPPTYLEF